MLKGGGFTDVGHSELRTRSQVGRVLFDWGGCCPKGASIGFRALDFVGFCGVLLI